MARADYWLCDVCDGKSFYDANLDWDYAREKNSVRPDDGRMIPVGAGDMAVICVQCAKTHKVVVKMKAAPTGDIECGGAVVPSGSSQSGNGP